jgi:hypothetical protein
MTSSRLSSIVIYGWLGIIVGAILILISFETGHLDWARAIVWVLFPVNVCLSIFTIGVVAFHEVERYKNNNPRQYHVNNNNNNVLVKVSRLDIIRRIYQQVPKMRYLRIFQKNSIHKPNNSEHTQQNHRRNYRG